MRYLIYMPVLLFIMSTGCKKSTPPATSPATTQAYCAATDYACWTDHLVVMDTAGNIIPLTSAPAKIVNDPSLPQITKMTGEIQFVTGSSVPVEIFWKNYPDQIPAIGFRICANANGVACPQFRFSQPQKNTSGLSNLTVSLIQTALPKSSAQLLKKQENLSSESSSSPLELNTILGRDPAKENSRENTWNYVGIGVRNSQAGGLITRSVASPVDIVNNLKTGTNADTSILLKNTPHAVDSNTICTNDSGCSDLTPHCFTQDTTQACYNSTYCTSNPQTIHAGTCLQCDGGDQQCPQGKQCAMPGVCVDCNSSDSCSALIPVCNITTNTCVARCDSDAGDNSGSASCPRTAPFCSNSTCHACDGNYGAGSGSYLCPSNAPNCNQQDGSCNRGGGGGGSCTPSDPNAHCGGNCFARCACIFSPQRTWTFSKSASRAASGWFGRT
ncbi:MAG: hypothetical protein WCK49_08880 [Myxococcaceae bacterium]